MAAEPNDVIISRTLKAIYYSIIADCTSDISRKEHLSLTIRFVHLSGDKVEHNEDFLGFTSDDGTTEVLIEMLTKHGCKLRNC